ncbi:MAG TPA: KpsF/GutQ family sugar-phosphate isomerase [bacterium]|nr:KpsF/GutQ family sugar-phosphate isomerase [bacterium]
MTDILAELKRALQIEVEGIQGLIGRLDESFVQAVQMLYACEGRVVVTGVGKSGHVGNKIAATLASTGTKAFFMHPAEAIHGDLGMVGHGDVVLAISNSGQTEELIRLLGPLRRIDAQLIGMTGNPQSELAQRVDVHLNVGVPREACPLNLTPTASTTAALAMGDAIAVTLLSMRNFREEDYYLFHRGGSLGKKLLTTVRDLMASGEQLPLVRDDATVEATVREVQDKNWGLTAVVDGAGRLVGAFSLGDLLRLHTKDPSLQFMKQPVSGFMTRNPRAVEPDMLAARALNIMETHNIRALFVTDAEAQPVGIIGIYEVLKSIDY